MESLYGQLTVMGTADNVFHRPTFVMSLSALIDRFLPKFVMLRGISPMDSVAMMALVELEKHGQRIPVLSKTFDITGGAESPFASFALLDPFPL
jgi:hypothetical protein